MMDDNSPSLSQGPVSDSPMIGGGKTWDWLGLQLSTETITNAQRAVRDLAASFNRMRRVGVTFTEAQQEAIRRLADEGDIVAAQQTILGIIEESGEE